MKPHDDNDNYSDQAVRLWQACFPDVSGSWLRMFLGRVYRPDGLRVALDDAADGRVVSALYLHPYEMTFHGSTVPVSYLSLACTDWRHRSAGHMRRLLHRSLLDRAETGVMAVWLIPAAAWLRDYYERIGSWVTAAYRVDSSYLACHPFPRPQGLHPVEVGTDDPGALPMTAAYDAFRRFQLEAGECVVLHRREDFEAMVADCRMDGGRVVAMVDETGEVAAMAVAVPRYDSGEVVVKMAAGVDNEAAMAAAGAAASNYRGLRVTVVTPASNDYAGGGRPRLLPGAMARITDARLCLDLIAREAPDGWRRVVKVSDPVIAANCHTFVMEGGRGCHVDDSVRPSTIPEAEWFDVDIAVLARMVFSSKPASRLIGFPGVRPVARLLPE